MTETSHPKKADLCAFIVRFYVLDLMFYGFRFWIP